LVALLAVPLLLRLRFPSSAEAKGRKTTAISKSERWMWRAGIAIIGVSLVIQIISLAFWLPLEIYQMEELGHPTFVIALRLKNIAAFAMDKRDAWGLNTDAMHWDDWDYVHISTWNFLPFLLRRVGAAPAWVVRTAFVIWGAGIAGLLYCFANIRRMVEW
jgi:hypothetical protein